MAKTAYYKLELFFKHLHRWMLNLLYEKKMSNKVDRDDSWKGVKIQSTWKHGLYPKHPNDNNVCLFMELQNLNKSWKR